MAEASINDIKRHKDIDKFYDLLNYLEKCLGCKRILKECNGKMKWPERGVYFFFEPGEFRSSDTSQARVVRVGTHMVSKGSKATFWNRLRTHRGTEDGSGNHRGSVFRLLVGEALIMKSNGAIQVPTWSIGDSASSEIRKVESELEREVSRHIGEMSLLWLNVPDEASPHSDRAYIERNAIGLLSSFESPLDLPSEGWLGRFCPNEFVRSRGLWNINHIGYKYDIHFLEIIADYIEITAGIKPIPKQSLAAKEWFLYDARKIGKNQKLMFKNL